MALNKRMVLAVVPARGGSKGVVGKNMREVCGVPLIDYTLQAALRSQYIDEVFLSSDDTEALSYGKKIGVKTVVRPDKYSTDEANANDVLRHFLTTIDPVLIETNPYIVYLQPTSPMRTAAHIDEALKQMTDFGIDKLISVNVMSKSPFKAFVLDGQGCLQALFSEEMTNERRQDQVQVYLPNGAIYAFTVFDFQNQMSFPSNGSYPFVMEEIESLDIDTEDDLALFTEILMRRTI